MLNFNKLINGNMIDALVYRCYGKVGIRDVVILYIVSLIYIYNKCVAFRNSRGLGFDIVIAIYYNIRSSDDRSHVKLNSLVRYPENNRIELLPIHLEPNPSLPCI